MDDMSKHDPHLPVLLLPMESPKTLEGCMYEHLRDTDGLLLSPADGSELIRVMKRTLPSLPSSTSLDAIAPLVEVKQYASAAYSRGEAPEAFKKLWEKLDEWQKRGADLVDIYINEKPIPA